MLFFNVNAVFISAVRYEWYAGRRICSTRLQTTKRVDAPDRRINSLLLSGHIADAADGGDIGIIFGLP